jgi:hypothetical protein
MVAARKHDQCLDSPTQILPIAHRSAVLFKQQEVNLMNMKLVILQRPVFDGPVLRRSLRCHDGRRIVRIEQRRRLPIDGDEKVSLGAPGEP